MALLNIFKSSFAIVAKATAIVILILGVFSIGIAQPAKSTSSPNGKFVAKFSNSKEKKSLGAIHIKDKSGKLIREKIIFPKQTKLVRSIKNIDWLNDDLIGSELHIDPSTAEYRIFSLSDPKMEKSYIGSHFNWNNKHSVLIYKGWIPHFTPKDKKSDYLKIEDQKIYPSQDDTIKRKFLFGPITSPDNDYIAVIEERQDKQYFVVIKLLPDKNHQFLINKSVKEITMASVNNTPVISWEAKKALVVFKGNKKFSVDLPGK